MKILPAVAVAVDETDNLRTGGLVGRFELAAQAHAGRADVLAGHPYGQGIYPPAAVADFDDEPVAGDLHDVLRDQSHAGGGNVGQGSAQADCRPRPADGGGLARGIAVRLSQLAALPNDPQAAQRQQEVERVPSRADQHRVPHDGVRHPAHPTGQVARNGQQEHDVKGGRQGSERIALAR